jgi:hypothetical protein
MNTKITLAFLFVLGLRRVSNFIKRKVIYMMEKVTELDKGYDFENKNMECIFEIEGVIDSWTCQSYNKGRGCRYFNKAKNACMFPNREDKK